MSKPLFVITGALLLAGLVASSGMPAARQSSESAKVPDLSGGWLRLDTGGSGSFGGTAEKYPSAALTEAGRSMIVRGDGRNLIPEGGGSGPAHQAGDPYVVNNGACTPE